MYIVKLPVGILGVIIAHNLILKFKAYHSNLMEILLHIELVYSKGWHSSYMPAQ